MIHFDKGQFPPVKAFWSLTLYDPDFFFVPNSINRYELSQRNKFITNPDGSVDMYLQADSPGKAKEANWLPAPKGKFSLVMRMYWPTINGAVDRGRKLDAAGERNALTEGNKCYGFGLLTSSIPILELAYHLRNLCSAVFLCRSLQQLIDYLRGQRRVSLRGESR